jgi:hypothetical protein
VPFKVDLVRESPTFENCIVMEIRAREIPFFSRKIIPAEIRVSKICTAIKNRFIESNTTKKLGIPELRVNSRGENRVRKGTVREKKSFERDWFIKQDMLKLDGPFAPWKLDAFSVAARGIVHFNLRHLFQHERPQLRFQLGPFVN